MRSLAFAVLLGAAACGSSTGNLAAGQVCHASSECGPDLVCDFSQTPAVCAANGQLPADAAEIDARVIPTPDGKPGTPDAMPTPDASPPDADLPDADMDAMM